MEAGAVLCISEGKKRVAVMRDISTGPGGGTYDGLQGPQLVSGSFRQSWASHKRSLINELSHARAGVKTI